MDVTNDDLPWIPWHPETNPDEEPHARLARSTLSAGSHLGWSRGQFQPVRRECDEGGALPVRQHGRDQGIDSHPAGRADRAGLAQLLPRHHSRASSTATAYTARSSRPRATGSIPRSSCSIRTPRRSARDLKWDDSLFGYQLNHPDADLTLDERDSAAFAPLAAVVDTAFTWGDDRPPSTPWHKTFIYELHVKGFTKLMQEVPDKARGTYSGLASEASVTHLRDLGVTAVELLPVHYHVGRSFPHREGPGQLLGLQHARLLRPRPALRDRPESGGDDPRVQDDGPVAARGGHRGHPRRRLQPHRRGQPARADALVPGDRQRQLLSALAQDPRYYMDFTGCGNTFNMRHPQVLQLIMDSLRYWVLEMHVDGFRFDLASTLARELYEVDRLGAFFDIIHQDPILSQVKLIAEPWDVGPGGYQVGFFPVLWTEWNGKYRDNLRRFWKGDGGTVSEFATRLAGSSDLYQQTGRAPYASVNFVTCHDGFTLEDLVSYNDKHNEANGEENRDGSSSNDSWNCGVEGPTDNPVVLQLREKQKRNFLVTLMLSQGVSMLLAGDEFGHTQKGNNNAYCQDNELTWLNWDLDERQQKLLEFTRKLSRIWREHPVFQRRKFFQGRALRGSDIKDISFLEPSGAEMSDEAWNGGFVGRWACGWRAT